ncbi:MAG: hypothetical protein SGARI_003891, partial [Bacillariaceae sp.]
MSPHELRRAISRGPFTELLDELATTKQVQQAFAGNTNLEQDDIQQLLLRYYSLICCKDTAQFGKPSIAQQGLETMKRLNKDMEHWEAQDSTTNRKELAQPLLDAMRIATEIFNENEVFRRVAPIVKRGKLVKEKRVWMNTSKAHPAIFDCVVFCLSRDGIRKRYKDLWDNREAVRADLIDVMQRHPSFTDTLRVTGTSERVRVMEEGLHSLLESVADKQSQRINIPRQTRIDLIA